jgi:hypothetical protein
MEEIKIHIEIGDNLRSVLETSIQSVDTYVSSEDSTNLITKVFDSIRKFAVDILTEKKKGTESTGPN